MNKIKLKNEVSFPLRESIEQTTRDGKIWSLRFEIVGYYTPEFLVENFIPENTILMKVLNENDEELLVLENYDTIITMQIYTHIADIEESFVTIQMKKEMNK